MSSLKIIAVLLSIAPASINAIVPERAGYTITWSDDFVGARNSPPDPANWQIDLGTAYPEGGAPNWGTGENQTYTNLPENVALAGDGNLAITPLRNEAGAWTSGRIETVRTDFMADEGGRMRIEGSIFMPNTTGDAAVGYWPAFWTLGGSFRGVYTNWPAVGELDILENVNGRNLVFGTLHCDVNPGGVCNENNGLAGNSACGLGTPCQGNFHTYAVTVDRSITPETISWEVDGNVYMTISEETLGAAIWAQTVQHGHFLLLNVAIGGSFPDKDMGSVTPTPATVPGSWMLVDYVAVYNSV